MIDRTADGGCIALPRTIDGRRTRFRVDGTLRIVDRTKLTILGGGAILYTDRRGPLVARGPARRSQRAQIEVIRGAGIEVRDLVIDGPNPEGRYDAPYEEEAGIRLSGVDGAIVRNVAVREVFGDAVSVFDNNPVSGSGVVIPSRSVLITRLRADRIGRQGVAITSGDGVTIERSRLSHIARSVFDIEPLPRRSVSHVRIVRNVIGKHSLLTLAAGGAGPKSDVTLASNRVSQPIRVKFYDGVRFAIVGNVGGGSAENAIVSGTGDELRVSDNTQRFAGPGQACPPNCGHPAIMLQLERGSVCHAIATNNRFEGARALFGGDAPPAPCGWSDGGGNSLTRS